MRNTSLTAPGAIAAGMLLLAVGSLPYGYYMLLRWVVATSAVVFAFSGYIRRRMWAVWLFGFFALLFNPIRPIHFSREIWRFIDIVSAAVFIVGIRGLAKGVR